MSAPSPMRARAPALAIVVLTGLDDEHGVGVEAVRRGAQDFLPKRAAWGDLLPRTLRFAVERKRSEEALAAVAKQRADV